jgi:hypothetical protein
MSVYVLTYQLQARTMLCFTDQGAPAIFVDASDAELLAAKRREEFPGINYRVLTCPVL